MYRSRRTCILPAVLIGSAILYYYGEKMEEKKGGSHMEPMVIFPKGMERKAKALMKEVRKAWDEII